MGYKLYLNGRLITVAGTKKAILKRKRQEKKNIERSHYSGKTNWRIEKAPVTKKGLKIAKNRSEFFKGDERLRKKQKRSKK